MRRLPLFLVALLLSLAFVPGGARPSGVLQPMWVMAELNARSDASAAYAVNARGDVVGTSRDPGGVAVSGSRDDPRLVVWRRNGTMTVMGRTHIDLRPGFLLNDRGRVVWKQPAVGWMLWTNGKKRKLGWMGASAMNDHGQIVGSSRWPDGRSRAALWENGRLHDLGVLPGGILSEATSINDTGAVVGTSTLAAASATRAFIWRAGKMRDLGVLSGFDPSSSYCFALQINRRGEVLGHCVDDRRLHGFLWDGAIHDLRVGTRAISPVALNDRAHVVGTDRVNGRVHPFLWVHGKVTDLGTLGGELKEAWPTAINDHGQVIGVSGSALYGPGHAFVWENGVMTDLAPAAAASQAVAINDKGQIVGWVSTGGGRTHAVVWTRSGS